MEVQCGCGRIYEYDRKKRGGHLRTKCNSCISNYRRAEKKKRAVEYKGGKCQKCGYNKCIRALEFHHRDRSTKSFEIGQDLCRSWVLLKAELDKCDLLCSNCHAEEESLIADSYNGKTPA